MKINSARECIDRILRDIDKRRIVDYTDRNSVRQYNAAMDRIIKTANYLCDYFPDQMDLFIELVNHSDYIISATCTGILFGLRNSTKAHKLAALMSARRLLVHPEANELEREFYWPSNIAKWEAELKRLD